MRKLKDLLEKKAKDNRKRYEEKVTQQNNWLIPPSTTMLDPKVAGLPPSHPLTSNVKTHTRSTDQSVEVVDPTLPGPVTGVH
jgi:hypothetical protein